MALHNPAMDHRIVTTVARFILAYAFVYYYVFVYVGCTLGLWLVFSASRQERFQAKNRPPSDARLVVLLLLAIALGLIAGSYLDPLLSRLGLSDAVVEEVRMHDIPFCFVHGDWALIGIFETRSSLHDMRVLISGATLLAFIVYAAVRLFGLGDAADYDSIAFFGYAALLCILLFALDVRSPHLAELGSGSYFIYLWHIFIVEDLARSCRTSALTGRRLRVHCATVLGSIVLLLAIRHRPPHA